jgi:hypothetical protein
LEWGLVVIVFGGLASSVTSLGIERLRTCAGAFDEVGEFLTVISDGLVFAGVNVKVVVGVGSVALLGGISEKFLPKR